jgi:DNA-directed RNA polymerase specialized sigma subunit
MQTLEPADAYKKFHTDRNQTNLASVVGSLRPTIDYALLSVNSKGDPLLKAEAKLIAANAVESFDPDYGVDLKTHVTNSLQKLSRVARKHRSPINLPERHQIDSMSMNRAKDDFMESQGREPTIEELADKTGLSMKRIRKLNERQFQAITDSTLEGDEGFSESSDYTQDALDYVYQDSDYIDKKILEYKMGYSGAQPLDGATIAAKLDINPSQVSRRSAKLLLKIQENLDLLQDMDTEL